MDMTLHATRKTLLVALTLPNDATHYTLYGGEYVWWKKQAQHPGEEPVWFFANQYLVDNRASWAIYTQDIPQTGLTEIKLLELEATTPNTETIGYDTSPVYEPYPVVELEPGSEIILPGLDQTALFRHAHVVLSAALYGEYVYLTCARLAGKSSVAVELMRVPCKDLVYRKV